MRVLTLTALLMIPGAAMAQSDFKAEDIIQHFKQQIEQPAAEDAKPKTRAVVIGASGFGDKTDTPAPAAAAFNLLVTFDLNSDRSRAPGR